MSSLVKTAFTSVVTKLTDNSDVHTTFKQIIIRTIGNRDYSIQEVMHQLLSLKCVSSSFEVVIASLDGSRRINVSYSQQFCTEPSILDIYSQREKYLDVDPHILNYNFVQFVSMFILKGKRLTKRSKDAIVKSYPNYSSNPANEHYGLFCKYQLLKYKPWKGTPNMAWNYLEQNNEAFIASWKQYLSCEQSKQLVPNWETKMEDVNSYLIPLDNSETFDSEEEEKEEWMLMAELSFKVEDEHDQSVIPPEEYWSDQRKNYCAKQIGEMPSWISEMKKRSNPDWCVSPKVIQVKT